MRPNLAHAIKNIGAIQKVTTARPDSQAERHRLIEGPAQKKKTIPAIGIQCADIYALETGDGLPGDMGTRCEE